MTVVSAVFFLSSFREGTGLTGHVIDDEIDADYGEVRDSVSNLFMKCPKDPTGQRSKTHPSDS